MPALTVRTDGSQRTFAPGNDVVIGRDLRADVRVAHPLVSRAHIVLRFDHGRSWRSTTAARTESSLTVDGCGR